MGLLVPRVLAARHEAKPPANTVSPSINVLTFHGDAQRTGWNSRETILTPATVATAFGPLWDSPPFDAVTIGTATYAPHLYATPLYVDDLLVTRGEFSGFRFRVVIAATSNGFVYAVNAFATAGATSVPAGTILWRTHLGTPGRGVGLDGDVPRGVLGTPVIDLQATPPRLYVASDVTDAERNWKLFALDLGNGAILPGWPLTINDAAINDATPRDPTRPVDALLPLNRNGPATFLAALAQRGALNLRADGRVLYVPFGNGGAGWMVAVDTVTARVASAFSAAHSAVRVANGGMWGAGGPAIDAAGNVYETTGNSPPGSARSVGVWGNSLLVWGPSSALPLIATYSPWNYCQMDTFDADLAAGTPVILPDLDPAATRTPRLVAFGSKQGTVYLLDRDHLPAALERRPPCSADSTTDQSLLAPDRQPHLGARGPLNVFGPYSESFAQVDFAKMRTTPAYFQSADGTSYLFVSGSTKASIDSRDVVPPSLVRLRVVTAPGQSAYLAVDAADRGLAFRGPGSPMISSNGARDAIVWVLDANVLRSEPLLGGDVPHPVRYAVDATTMTLLWRSAPGALNVGGKYNHPTIARGVVFVGTNRVQAFGTSGR